MAESTVTVRLSAPPERVWEVMTDLTRWDWRRDLERIEVSGESGFIEVDKSGVETNFIITNWEPLALWEFDIDNPNLSGHWRGELQAAGGGTILTLSESVTAKKLWLRPMVKTFLKNQQAAYLEDLQKAL